MTDTRAALRNLFSAGRPLVEQWLDLAEEFSALREAATQNGIDWSQVKALLKAQVQDERDGGDGRRVARIVEKADFASSYADMLGLGPAKMNENNFSAPSNPKRTDAQQSSPQEPSGSEGVKLAPSRLAVGRTAAGASPCAEPHESLAPSDDPLLGIPPFLDRRASAEAS